MTILVPGSPQDKRRELMIGSIMTGASSLAVMDNSSTSTVLRAIAHMLDQQVQREFKLCTHGCDISPGCKNRTKNECGLKTTRCEDEKDNSDRMPEKGSDTPGAI